MVKKANITWSIKQFTKMISKGTVTFDNVVQRGYVWDVKRKSLLIHSILTGYPIPAFYAAKSENGYDMLDGKQRSLSLSDFLDDKFALTGIPDVEVETDDGVETIDLNGMKFSELDENIQDEITSYMLTIYYFDGISDDEVSEMFFRLNNGKPLSAIELTRVKAKSIESIKRIGSHDLFASSLTESAISKYTNEDIVIKSYILLHEEEPSLETKAIRSKMETIELTTEDEKQLAGIYTRILNCYNVIPDKKIQKKVVTKTHLLSIVPVINESIEKEYSEDDLVDWLISFFSSTDGATISDSYNKTCGGGSAKKESVRTRLTEIQKSFEEFFN